MQIGDVAVISHGHYSTCTVCALANSLNLSLSGVQTKPEITMNAAGRFGPSHVEDLYGERPLIPKRAQAVANFRQ